MRYSKTLLTTVFVALVFSVTGCGDSFFTRPPEGELTADNFYNSEQDLRRATGALYNQVWFDWNNSAAFVIGDSRAGTMWSTDVGYSQFISFSITSENGQLVAGWRSLYLAINQSNLVIQNIRNKTEGKDISDEAINQAIAEARFIRGYAYSYLAELWGAVPIVTNTPRLIDQPEKPRVQRDDVLQFAINDFEYAADHLPTDPANVPPGRVTEWSAKGMLARTYWARATYNDLNSEYLTQARNYAQEVITQSGMSLRENYGDLFLLSEEETNNRQESLFSLQWTYQGNTWGTQNTRQAYWAVGELTGFADGWGGGTGVQGWVLEAFGENTNPNSFDYSENSSFGDDFEGEGGDFRRPETFMMNDDQYENLLPDSTYTYALDDPSGAYTGNATAMKKYVIGKPGANSGRVAQQRTGIDTYMLRLAEVYLTYAQAAQAQGDAGSGSLAEEYYNRVRTRAGLSPSNDGLTHEELFMEKFREFAFEGLNWFSLVRWHAYEPDAAVQFIEDQRRGYTVSYNSNGEILVEEPSDYEPLQVPDPAVDPADPESWEDNVFFLPYPEQDLIQNDLMYQAPVEYDFSNQGSGSSE